MHQQAWARLTERNVPPFICLIGCSVRQIKKNDSDSLVVGHGHNVSELSPTGDLKLN